MQVSPHVAFYNQRATAEQRIKESMNAVSWTRLPYHRCTAISVRLQLHGLAYNLADFLRTLTLKRTTLGIRGRSTDTIMRDFRLQNIRTGE